MSNKANYNAKVIRHYGDSDRETLDEIITEFENHLGYMNDEIVECDDGHCYRIFATLDVEEISQEDAAELTGWDEDNEEPEPE